MEIIPSIIASNLEEIKLKIEQVAGLVSWVEIDIADGLFVSNLTWPLVNSNQEIEDLKINEGQDQKTKISVHLMTEKPEAVIARWQTVADRIIVHYESTDKIEDIISTSAGGDKLGLALALDTPVEKIYPYLDKIKLVQLMSIEKLGYAGQNFVDQVFTKIKTLKFDWPEVKIIIDGGVNLEIARQLMDFNVAGLIVGSAIWQETDIPQAIANFQKLSDSKN